MENKIKFATKLGLYVNIFLFIIKMSAGILSNSIAVISDAANSLIDILSSFILFFGVKISQKKADLTHPFGHYRAEPIAAFVVAIFTGILGFELLKESIFRIFTNPIENITFIVIIVMIITILTKTQLYIYFRKIAKQCNSPSINAFVIDSKNDVLITSVALFGIIMTHYGLNLFDSIAGIFISLWIFKAGYSLAIENIGYLMGKSPSKENLDKIIHKALCIKGVLGTNDIRAHYVGNHYQVELHIEVDEDLTTKQSHKICKDVENKIEAIHYISKAFIHVDPIKKKSK
jgi:cation diffusion facilitator family transporter